MPASMASRVDLPAPFGPISPVIVPRRTAERRRRRPPGRRRTRVTRRRPRGRSRGPAGSSAAAAADTGSRRGADTGAGGHGGSRRARRSRGGGRRQDAAAGGARRPTAGGLDHPLALGQDALRPHPEEHHDQQPDRHPLQRRDQVRRKVVGRGDVPGDLLEADRHQDRPEDGAEVVARPADDHRREQHHGLRVAPRRRRPGGDVGDQDAAAEPGDGPAGHQHRACAARAGSCPGSRRRRRCPAWRAASGRTATR